VKFVERIIEEQSYRIVNKNLKVNAQDLLSIKPDDVASAAS